MSNTSVPQDLILYLGQQRDVFATGFGANDPFVKAHVAKIDGWIAALSTPTGADAPSLASSGSLKCIECEGPVQWRCPACKISSGSLSSQGASVGTQDAASASDSLPDGAGPHEPALLTTDAAMLAQARALRAFLLDRAEQEGDTSAGHSAACYTLLSAVQSLIFGHAQEIAYYQAQDGLLENAQQEAKRLREELAEVKRPLDAQMARLNQRVIELTAELDSTRMRPSSGAGAQDATQTQAEE